MGRILTPPTCQNCISFNAIKNSCKEQSSDFYGGSISPFHLACPKYISTFSLYARKNRPKRWFRVKTMDDMSDSRARLY